MKNYPLKLNLQLFAEDDDMILPDDFVESPPQDEETQEPFDTVEDELVPDGEDTTPPEGSESETETATEPTASQTFKLKYNHEERVITLDEATQLAQKGMNYDKAIERAAQEARDAVYADMGYEWNGKPITTEAEYKQALQERDLLEKHGDLPDEIKQELLENRRFRNEYQSKQKEQEAQAKKDADIAEFFDYFQEVNERQFDPKKDTIPQEVRDAVDNGQSLKYAYMQHQNKELRNKLKVAMQNEQNNKRAPVGSVTAHGGTSTEAEDIFLQGFNSIN